MVAEHEIVTEIRSICCQFVEVEEAYFLVWGQDRQRPGVLGLLCRGLHAERRYELTERIAHCSKQFFGCSSAIDVFDDLDVRSTATWDIFKSHSPIYIREGLQGMQK